MAATLERAWEQALCKQRTLEEDAKRHQREMLQSLSEDERAAIRSLATDLPAMWNASQTTVADRKEIVRCLVERVVVHVEKHSEYVDATIHWHGGFTSQHEIIRPVYLYEQLRDHKRLIERITQLHAEGHTAVQVAAKLNAEGFVPPKRMGSYTRDLVRLLMIRNGLVGERTRQGMLGDDEWWLRDLARELQVSQQKLNDWVHRGWVHARCTPALGYWVVWADADELKRLRKLKARSKVGACAHPPELTTPGPRNRKHDERE